MQIRVFKNEEGKVKANSFHFFLRLCIPDKSMSTQRAKTRDSLKVKIRSYRVLNLLSNNEGIIDFHEMLIS